MNTSMVRLVRTVLAAEDVGFMPSAFLRAQSAGLRPCLSSWQGGGPLFCMLAFEM